MVDRLLRPTAWTACRAGEPAGPRAIADACCPNPQADRIKGLIDDNAPRRNWASTTPRGPAAPVRELIRKEFHIDLAEPNGRPVPAPLGLHVQEARAATYTASKIPDEIEEAGCTRSTRPSSRKATQGGCGDSVDRARSARRRGPPARSWARRGKGSVQPWKSARGRTFG